MPRRPRSAWRGSLRPRTSGRHSTPRYLRLTPEGLGQVASRGRRGAPRSWFWVALLLWGLGVGVFEVAKHLPDVRRSGPREPSRWFIDGKRATRLQVLLQAADALVAPGEAIELRAPEADREALQFALWGALLLPQRDVRAPGSGDGARFVACFECSVAGAGWRRIVALPEGSVYERVVEQRP